MASPSKEQGRDEADTLLDVTPIENPVANRKHTCISCCATLSLCLACIFLIVLLWLAFGPLPTSNWLCGRAAAGLPPSRIGNWTPSDFSEYGAKDDRDYSKHVVQKSFDLSIVDWYTPLGFFERVLVRYFNMHTVVPLDDGNFACPESPTEKLFPVIPRDGLEYGYFWRIEEASDGKKVMRFDHWVNKKPMSMLGGLRYDIWRPSDDFSRFDSTGHVGTFTYEQTLVRAE